jgi:hypothetical protein
MKPRRLTRTEITRRIDAIDPADAIRGRVETDEAARHDLETARGEPYSDAEWREAKNNLLSFMAIVAAWTNDAEVK